MRRPQRKLMPRPQQTQSRRPRSKTRAVIAPVKRLPAVQVNADGTQPNAAAVDATAANDQKPSVKQDPSPASDKATVDQPQPTAPIPTNSNQAVPVVAAVTAIVVTEQDGRER